QRNGQVYLRGRDPLNHSLHADYLEQGVEREFRLGYGTTVHKLTITDHIEQVFGPVLGKKGVSSLLANGTTIRASDAAKRATKHIKNIETQTRRLRGTVQARQLHNKLQNRFREILVAKYGEGKVFLERNFVDLVVQDKDQLILYEVKPYSSVVLCVREALGQVITYAWKEQLDGTRKIKLVVVGPNRPNAEEKQFLHYVKDNLTVDFDYEQCA
ncbi:MAG: hypothetical protein ACK4UN_19280, partial [Limisphaerales bacterium]